MKKMIVALKEKLKVDIKYNTQCGYIFHKKNKMYKMPE